MEEDNIWSFSTKWLILQRQTTYVVFIYLRIHTYNKGVINRKMQGGVYGRVWRKEKEGRNEVIKL